MAANRPLSPHLQIYRWQLTMLMSITHRATGIALAVGTALLLWWLMALASGPQAYAQASAVLGSGMGRLALFLWTAALFYHLCNGLRHLFWDAGYGFRIESAYRSGYAVLAAAALLTAVTWIAAGGGA